MDIFNKEVGGRIKEIRKERGITQEQLAEYADVSVDFIGLVETGKSTLKVSTLAKIATALNISSDYLIYGDAPYVENPKINAMLAKVPDSKKKQAEKLVALFLSAISTDDSKKM
ncbi:MAG: helix-turn-helix transcriptional regulator [Lachnospiraceae bacterium]|nr:helix-turn-helix transcriptional regulator [Ruminococcus sp.]MCM1276411.1 helix-turn-helix transcriptional regulator [Lachnospiraceae bacterium]